MKEGKTESEKDMFFLIVPESAVAERQSSVVINQLNNNQSTPVSYAVAEKKHFRIRLGHWLYVAENTSSPVGFHRHTKLTRRILLKISKSIHARAFVEFMHLEVPYEDVSK